MVRKISPLPQPPTRSSPADFSNRADAFLGALPNFQAQANNLASDLEQAVSSIDDRVSVATQKAAEAAASASSASSKLGQMDAKIELATAEVEKAKIEVTKAEAKANLAEQKASEAASSANTARQWATQAESALTSLGDVWLGKFGQEPSSAEDGALYFDTTLSAFRVRVGTQWQTVATTNSGSYRQPTPLGDTSLNNARIGGVYVQSDASLATASRAYPVNLPGILTVQQHANSFFTQTYVTTSAFGSSSPMIFTRSCNNNVAGRWSVRTPSAEVDLVFRAHWKPGGVIEAGYSYVPLLPIFDPWGMLKSDEKTLNYSAISPYSELLFEYTVVLTSTQADSISKIRLNSSVMLPLQGDVCLTMTASTLTHSSINNSYGMQGYPGVRVLNATGSGYSLEGHSNFERGYNQLTIYRRQ